MMNPHAFGHCGKRKKGKRKGKCWLPKKEGWKKCLWWLAIQHLWMRPQHMKMLDSLKKKHSKFLKFGFEWHSWPPNMVGYMPASMNLRAFPIQLYGHMGPRELNLLILFQALGKCPIGNDSPTLVLLEPSKHTLIAARGQGLWFWCLRLGRSVQSSPKPSIWKSFSLQTDHSDWICLIFQASLLLFNRVIKTLNLPRKWKLLSWCKSHFHSQRSLFYSCWVLLILIHWYILNAYLHRQLAWVCLGTLTVKIMDFYLFWN